MCNALPNWQSLDNRLQHYGQPLINLKLSGVQCTGSTLVRPQGVPMHYPLKTRFGAAFVLALTMAPLAVPRAQQPPPPAAPPKPATPATTPAAPGAPAAPAKVLVPVATNTVTANPDAFYGQAVTLTASVEQIHSKSAFSVDQRRVGNATLKGGPTDILVLVPTIQSPVDLKSYVTVLGEVVKFDPAEIAKKAKDYKLDLPADAIA